MMSHTPEKAAENAKDLKDNMEMKTEDVPETPPAPVFSFPAIARRLWDVFHEDERHEIWVGIKIRTTVKAQTREGGPVEDVEINVDPLSVVTSLDAAKQEVLMALNRDAQMLNEQRARRAALKNNGILGRLSEGLGKVFAGKLH